MVFSSTIWFLFFFNRLFASVVSYALCAYSWHKYRVYLDIQALQFSLLGGRVFFKGLRYHGHNETILVHDGYITWRYWLRRVRPLLCDNSLKGVDSSTFSHSTNDRNGGKERETAGNESDANKSASPLPCRIVMKARGIEWFVYNRSPAYDSILSKITDIEVPKDVGSDDRASIFNPDVKKHAIQTNVGVDKVSSETKKGVEDFDDHKGFDREAPVSITASSATSSETSTIRSSEKKSSELPKIVSFFPIKVECNKGAVVMGNENTRSILVAKFDNAIGQIEARNAQPIDSYRQSIDIDFIHPVIQFQENRDFKENQVVEGATHETKQEEVPISSFFRFLRSKFGRPISSVLKSFRDLNTLSRNSALSLAQSKGQPIDGYPHHERVLGVPGQSHWLGLTRYLDGDDDTIEQERWKTIEYGRFPTIIDSPKIAMCLHWDVPGLIPISDNNLSRPSSDDINGSSPPDWGIDLRILGGTVRYGPWADRQRANLQAVFFPGLRTDATPASKLEAGQPRVSTVFRLLIDIEEQTTIGVPTREGSKDWKWKGREAVRNETKSKQKHKKPHTKRKKDGKINETSEVRPFGWLDIKLLADSTISFTIDLVPGSKGSFSQINLDIRGPEISTSVNHGLLWRSKSQKISCDLSYPLNWNALHHWNIDIQCESPEIFLLRDHIFLLTDLVDDWTSGPSGDFYTFVPFHYAINLDFKDFQLFINANDVNIINNPSDTDDNTFAIVHGKILSATVAIPLQVFSPTSNQIKFDVDAHDGGIKLLTPLWNTYRAFLDNSQVACVKDLTLKGSYDYFSTTSPELTDTLVLNLYIVGLKLCLHGFLVRYLMKIKDNYFGDDLHFRTLEEYQAQIAQGDTSGKGNTAVTHHNRLSNDLDVILTVTIEHPFLLLPSHVYSSSENVGMDIASIGVDLRFTNYYMDLAVMVSPIAISHYCLSEEMENGIGLAQSAQIFVDGLEISSHRLFGLPPSEPTYICNWDFVVGSVSGECYSETLQCLVLAFRSFAFTFEDAENALACARSQIIHDVTFLRARIAPLSLWLRLDSVALLLTLKESKVSYDDLAKQLCSGHLHIVVPSLTLAMISVERSSDDRSSMHSSAVTNALFETSIDLRMRKQTPDFQKDRQLQQSHISLQDIRTHRVPWLIEESNHPIQVRSSDQRSRFKLPAMQFPAMPEPVFKINNLHENLSTTSIENHKANKKVSRKASFLTVRSECQGRARRSSYESALKDQQKENGRNDQQLHFSSQSCSTGNIRHQKRSNLSSRHFPSFQSSKSDTVNKNNNAYIDFAFSSPYKKPHFPLFHFKVDLNVLPMVPHNEEYDGSPYEPYAQEVSKSRPLDQSSETSQLMLLFKDGIRAFFRPMALQNILALLKGLQSLNPSYLMDILQIEVMSEDLQTLKTREGRRRLFEPRLIIPHTNIRLSYVSTHSATLEPQFCQYDLSLERLTATGTWTQTLLNNAQHTSRSQSSIYVFLSHLCCSVRGAPNESSHALAVVKMTLYDINFKMLLGISSMFDFGFSNFKFIIAANQSGLITSLLHDTLVTSQALFQEFSTFSDDEALRIRLVILFLSKNGDRIPDPPFLTSASYLLRSAATHARAFDSWKMISRLRFIQQSLPNNLQDQLREQCMQEKPDCPENAGVQVAESFNHWRAWDIAHIRQSRLIRKVYSPLINSSPDNHQNDIPLQIRLRAKRIRILLEPGLEANDITFERFTMDIAINSLSKATSRSNLTDSPVIKNLIVQGHYSKATLRIGWDSVRFIEAIYHEVRDLPAALIAKQGSNPSKGSLKSIYRLHFMAAFKTTILNLSAINCQSISTYENLTASFILDSITGAQSKLASVVINADSVRIIIQRNSILVARLEFQRPTFTFTGNRNDELETKTQWKVASFCVSLSFEVLEEPLGLVQIATVVLRDEVKEISVLIQRLGLMADSPKSPKAKTDWDNFDNISMSLSLGQYSISFVVLPSLTYMILGEGVQCLMLPMKRENQNQNQLLIDFDLQAHAHLFTKRGRNPSDVISTLDIPSINSRYKLDLSSVQKIVYLHVTVEEVILNASALHALLNTLNRAEVKSLRRSLAHDVALLSTRSRKAHNDGSRLQEPSSLHKLPQYDARIAIAGFVIHASTREATNTARAAKFRFEIAHIKLRMTNIRPNLGKTLKPLDLEIKSKKIKAELTRLENSELRHCGSLSLEVVLESKVTSNDKKELVRDCQIRCYDLNIIMYTETASILLNILGHLQDTLRTIDVPKEVKSLRRLTRGRLLSEAPLFKSPYTDAQTKSEPLSLALFNDMYSLVMTNIRVTWIIGSSVQVSPDREAEDLILSFKKIDLTTRRNNEARLLIEDFQLQMAPGSKTLSGRASNSALLPEVVFNVAYLSTTTDRRLAFQAAGKSLDLHLTSRFILPASDLRRSIAIAIQDVRKATAAWNASTKDGSNPREKLLGKKRLASLLVDADFAGAVVYIQGRTVLDPHVLALTVLRGGRLPQQGRYGQFSQENAGSNTILRSPGIALKVEYKAMEIDQPSLNAEFKIDASSNVLYPTVVPLIMEISSSIKEIVGESDIYSRPPEPKSPQIKLLDDEKLRKADPSTILGNCELNLGLRICRQEFSLSCQPIARVATTAYVEAIYITVNTVKCVENGQFFTLSASFDRSQASVQHVYSRDSTARFEIDSFVLSVMNSKHVSTVNGMSAILKISPMKAQINARQLHDFLLFREIWVPPDLRRSSPLPEPAPVLEPQAFIVQRYQQVAAARAFPWNATVSIAELNVQLELGQSLGKSTFVVSNFWVSSKKSSNWEQNLCLGFEKIAINSVGRMSGSLELQNFKVRTSIHWPIKTQVKSRAPLIQASVGFDHLRAKAAFDFQTFLVADIIALEFLMYNVRDSRQAQGDRLVGIVNGEKVQLFITTTSAAQALALYQTFERLIQEKQTAYETSLKEIEKYLRRRSSVNLLPTRTPVKKDEQEPIKNATKAPLQLQTNVVVTLKSVNIGAFPSTFFDNQIFKVEALDASARFAVVLANSKLHSTLEMALGQLRVALSGVSRVNISQPLGEVSIGEVVVSAAESRGGTILKVPRLLASMQTWQMPQSNNIEYTFGSSFQGKVDVGWNYSRISFLRGMWTAHTRALAQRLGKPLPPSALQITGGLLPGGENGIESSTGSQEKITAVVNVPQSKFLYIALQPPVIETPQLRDMGEATPPLEWIGLHRDRLPNLTHQIVIVSLLELAKEVEDAYHRILGTS